MASVLNIDGYSLVEYLRVASDDGLDPVDADRLAPQFGEAASGEGDPLISVHEGNAEHVWPLHLTPLKTATFADTMDGLHQMVTDLNRRLAAAAQVEWRMDGATTSTFIDVVHARFEADFNYRKAQKLWVSGVLRVWAEPYGHTGTSRIVGTALATLGRPAVAQVASGALVGDTNADTALIVAAANGTTWSGWTFAAVAPASVPLFWAAASMTVIGGGTLTGASGAIASQARRKGVHAAASSIGDLLLYCGPSEPFTPGRYRVIGMGRSTMASGVASGVAVNTTLDSSPTSWQPGPTVVLANGQQWRVLDLGVISVPSRGVDVPSLPHRLALQAGLYGAATVNASGYMDWGAVVLLPEDACVAIPMSLPGNGTAGFLTYDNDYLMADSAITGIASVYLYDTANVVRGRAPRLPVGSGRQVLAFAARENGAQNEMVARVEVRVRERFAFCR